MRIGIILHRINPNYKGGVNSYILGLLEGFKKVDKNNEYILLVSSRNRGFFEKFEGGNFIIKEINLHQGKGLSLVLKNKLSRVIVDYFAILPGIRILFPRIYKLVYRYFISLINNLDVDVLYCHHELPIYFEKPTVVNIHDIQHVHYPEFFSWGQRLHRYIFYQETVKLTKIVQASSDYIKKDFINYFRLSPKKVITIRCGVNNIFKRKIDQPELIHIKNKYNLPQEFIFYPAQHWPHKNHLNLIKAVSFLRKNRNLKISLVFTGEKKREFSFLYKAINNSGFKGDIKLLGNVLFNELPSLYKLATITIISSFHESNSLPVMEALTIGCPVIASNIGSHLELNVNDAITIFNPNDYRDMAEKIQLLWDNKPLRDKKIKLGQELAKEFSWEKAAKEYLLVFEKIHKN